MFCLLPVIIGMSKYQLNRRVLPLIGICAGVACLVRNTALAIVAVCLLWILLGAIERTSWPSRLRNAATFLSGFMLIVLPWSAYASYELGHPVFIADNTAANIKLGSRVSGEHKRDDDVETAKTEEVTFTSYSWVRVKSMMSLWSPLPAPSGQDARKWYSNTLSMWWSTPGFLIALAVLIRQRRKVPPEVAFSVVCVACYTLALALVYTRLRYRLAVEPMLYASAMWGWCQVYPYFAQRKLRLNT